MGMTRYGGEEGTYVEAPRVHGAAAHGREVARCWFFIARSLAIEILEPCGAFEWVALFYLGVSGALMLIFHQNLAHAALHITAHFAVMAGILLIVNVADRFGGYGLSRARFAPTFRWIRNWYPQLVFLFCFEELAILVHLIFPAWRDSILIAFDHRLTGVYPAVWLAQYSSFWLNETMQVAYISYFLFLTIVGASIYHRRRVHSDASHSADPFGADALRAFWTLMTASIVAYSIGYLISIFFPVEAPFFAMRSFHLAPLSGGPATRLINFIEGWGRVRGGAFPSAHVSGSFVALIGAWRYRRYLFWVFLPFFIAMCVSTVYCRYHYMADVFAGLLVGAVGFLLADRLMAVPGANPAERASLQS
ncbi:MAG: phosphatase PAP2 family protein [Candidatus Acidiferrales bacterium]